MAEDRAADWFQLEVAAGVVLSGGVILHATEGVWGIACDPFAESAVRRVSAMKGRQAHKGFVLIGAPGEFDRNEFAQFTHHVILGEVDAGNSGLADDEGLELVRGEITGRD